MKNKVVRKRGSLFFTEFTISEGDEQRYIEMFLKEDDVYDITVTLRTRINATSSRRLLLE